MRRRYVAIWFRYLVTDRMQRRYPLLKGTPFVTAAPEHGRMVVKAANAVAQAKGAYPGMVVADCRAVCPGLQVLDDDPTLACKLLYALAEWCIRYTPITAVDLPDGLILDASGCAHLWGGEQRYLDDIAAKLNGFGYHVQLAMADTIGTAWAIARYGKDRDVVERGEQLTALIPLPPSALRLEDAILARLQKLGLYQVKSFIKMPRNALRRRFGDLLLQRLDQALGQEVEFIEPVKPIEPYQERLPSFEPIKTATGIEIALRKLLEQLCAHLTKDEKGLRKAVFKAYRIDNNIQQIAIGTNRPSRNVAHLYKLFEIKIANIEPDLGIELFILEAPVVEDIDPVQEAIWNRSEDTNGTAVAELLDRIACKLGADSIHRYLPDEHYWPERSMKLATTLQEQAASKWRTDMPRPVQLLWKPEEITVMVPIPDYPPMLFHYKGKVHQVTKADGPERIEQEWWIAQGLYRDYYVVEDEEGARYWLFRLGHYDNMEPKWFIHGFFA